MPPDQNCFLVEGPVDALKLISWHYETVATFGDLIFKEQMELLDDNVGKLILVPDRDDSGDLWVQKVKQGLGTKLKIDVLYIEKEFKDVGNKNYIREMFEKSLIEQNIKFI